MLKKLLFSALSLAAFASCKQTNTLYVATDFTKEGLFTAGIEGPATDKSGNLYAVNFERQGTIGIVSPSGKASLFIELPEGSTGNSIRFNSKGDMLIADYTGHNILKVDMPSKQISVLAHDSCMNQPNDIAITADDYLYASDPNWKEGTGNLWLITPNGTTQLLEKEMGTTNGIEVSPDGKRLYVNESKQLNVWIYDIANDKTVSNKRLLHKFEGYGLDGMSCDENGNLFICRHEKGTVAIISPNGDLIREVEVTGTKPSNITLHDGKAYVTLQDRGCVARFSYR